MEISNRSFSEAPDSRGITGSLELLGAVTYMAIVINVNVKILTSTSNHNFLSFAIVIFSLGTFLVLFRVVTLIPGEDWMMVYTRLLKMPVFYFSIIFFSSALVLVEIGMGLVK